MSGVLCRGQRRQQTLGSVPENPEHEVVVFWLDPEGSTSFAVSRPAFGGAVVERDADERVVLRMHVEPNEVAVVATT